MVARIVNYGAQQKGTQVEIFAGDVKITTDYRTTLKWAQLMRIAARRAKAMAGDTSMNTVGSLGLLTDAEADELEQQGLRDPTIALPPVDRSS